MAVPVAPMPEEIALMAAVQTPEGRANYRWIATTISAPVCPPENIGRYRGHCEPHVQTQCTQKAPFCVWNAAGNQCLLSTMDAHIRAWVHAFCTYPSEVVNWAEREYVIRMAHAWNIDTRGIGVENRTGYNA